MTATATADPPAKPPLLERVGIASLARRGAASTASDGHVHLLDEKERAAINRIERWAIARAAIAGALSALAAATAEVLVVQHQETRPVLFWGVVGVVSAVAAILEIAFLSWDSLRTVHAMSVAAGVLTNDQVERNEVLQSLARAALEVPNPRANVFGLDPYKETRRSFLVASALVYKVKVSATNVILKLFVRRALGRAAFRAYVVPFVAVPATALWNALVCSFVLREARVRIFGPSLAQHVAERMIPLPCAPAVADACMRAVAACVVRSADMHPNHAALLANIRKRTGRSIPRDAEGSGMFLAAFTALTRDQQHHVLMLLRRAIVIDGKIARRERRLLKEALAIAHEEDPPGELDRLRKCVIHGLPLEALPHGVDRHDDEEVSHPDGVGV